MSPQVYHNEVMTIHEDDVRKGLSSDERYAKYFLGPTSEIDELPSHEQEFVDDAVHYLAQLASELGFEGMCRPATFENITAARIRVYEMMIEDHENPLGFVSRMLEEERVNAAQAADDAGLKALIEMKFHFTPEAVYMYKFGTPTIGDLFKISTGTFLPI